MERWRVAVAIVSALAALPLLAIDNVSSADPDSHHVASAEDPSIALLATRAAAWTDAYENQREENVDEALAVGQQVQAEEAARAAQSAADAAAAAASRRAADAKRKADAAARASTHKSALPPALPPVVLPPRRGDPTAEQWAALRACEGSGDYTAVSAQGRFRGAYQFDQATWDLIARDHFPELVGVDPAAASPADQDAVALALYRIRGTSPWPRCGSALR